NSSPSVFNQLKGFYLQQAANQTDSLMIGTLKHLSDLCLVSAEEYLPAINNFDEIAQQNPNTDIALYRQIDALTTSLLMPQDSCLNKGVLGKYSVTNLSEYTNKLNELLSTRGKSGLESEKELLPTEYTLYQNYPNPFNPTTTIKYDLPNTSDVSLIIYDILGRKVKELVNTKQQAGRYEIQFNASNLASGVYIYQLIADKYFSSRKMILLK
ncbi:MAG: T9SS type A sorting domain-containing protein, partial [Ignavibacteriaceae bacterium]|nr:T9SS type A sorting domain-containing protein [Ignavibacteriaceae bacterium]